MSNLELRIVLSWHANPIGTALLLPPSPLRSFKILRKRRPLHMKESPVFHRLDPGGNRKDGLTSAHTYAHQTNRETVSTRSDISCSRALNAMGIDIFITSHIHCVLCNSYTFILNNCICCLLFIIILRPGEC